jgi:hypothetical protein
MTCFLLLLVTSFLPFGTQATSQLIFEKIDVTENSKYITSEFKIGTVAGQSTLSANFTVMKELNFRISVSLNFQSSGFN